MVFFNERLIGGSDDLQKLEAEGKLDQMIKECLESPDPDFPPPSRKPEGIEFVKVGHTVISLSYTSTLSNCAATLKKICFSGSR